MTTPRTLVTVVIRVPRTPVTRQECPGDAPDGGTFQTLTPATRCSIKRIFVLYCSRFLFWWWGGGGVDLGLFSGRESQDPLKSTNVRATYMQVYGNPYLDLSTFQYKYYFSLSNGWFITRRRWETGGPHGGEQPHTGCLAVGEGRQYRTTSELQRVNRIAQISAWSEHI